MSNQVILCHFVQEKKTQTESIVNTGEKLKIIINAQVITVFMESGKKTTRAE